jgi:hypothetical protein
LSYRPPSGSGWLHEIKFDGYRIIARKDDLQRGNGVADTCECLGIVGRGASPEADVIAVFASNDFLVVSAPGPRTCCKGDASRASIPRALLKL